MNVVRWSLVFDWKFEAKKKYVAAIVIAIDRHFALIALWISNSLWNVWLLVKRQKQNLGQDEWTWLSAQQQRLVRRVWISRTCYDTHHTKNTKKSVSIWSTCGCGLFRRKIAQRYMTTIAVLGMKNSSAASASSRICVSVEFSVFFSNKFIRRQIYCEKLFAAQKLKIESGRPKI